MKHTIEARRCLENAKEILREKAQKDGYFMCSAESMPLSFARFSTLDLHDEQ